MLRLGAVLLVLGCAVAPASWVGLEIGAFAAGTSLVPTVEAAVGPLCHHDPARTPSLGGQALPVCARCTGLYLGLAGGGLAGASVPLRPRWIARAAGGALLAAGIGLVAAVAEAAGLLATSNAVRVGLGVALGGAVPLIGALGGRLIARAEVAGRRRTAVR
jgi:uncharacterized membrane protein